MIEQCFNEVATQENATFNREDSIFSGGDGAQLTSTKYSLTCVYRNVTITLLNEYGHRNIGEVSCYLNQQPSSNAFRIESRSQISQLFNRRMSSFVTKAENSKLKQFIETNKNFLILADRAKADRFEPIIAGKRENGKYQIYCEYHLVFNSQELVISPFIKLFKELIDYLLDN